MPEPPHLWDRAIRAAQILAAGGARVGGLHLRARSGPVRDAFLRHLESLFEAGTPLQRIAPTTPVERLTGGLDVTATLARGKPVLDHGLLHRADGGVVLLAMAERAQPGLSGLIAGTMDEGLVRVARDGLSAELPARFALVALDEGADHDETIPHALADRLGLRVDLSTISIRETTEPGGTPVPKVDAGRIELPDKLLEAMTAIAVASGWTSLRAPLRLARVARIIAALEGEKAVSEEHAREALDLVLGPVAANGDAQEDPAPPQEQEQEPAGESPAPRETSTLDANTEIEIAAQAASRPLIDLSLSSAAKTRAGKSGKAGALANRTRRGRPIGTTDRPPFPGARPDLLATLRAAVPWQRLRDPEFDGMSAPRIKVRKPDFRYVRRRQNRESTAIFAVDASGSTALERLGEAKGAVELLLADCYVRRDSVALIAFRGTGAEIVLPPTRSLVRAKRSLAGLPGGGPTPLADGMMKALALARSVEAHGQTGLVILLTDGSGNISLEGETNRAAARESVEHAARRFAEAGVRGVVIDIGRRPRPAARELADSMRADYCALPAANAARLSSAIGDYMRGH